MSIKEFLYSNTLENLILDIDPECREIIDDIEFEFNEIDVEIN